MRYGQHPSYATPKQQQRDDAREERERALVAYLLRPTKPRPNTRVLRDERK